jgi:hypothetical protein
MKLDLQSLVAEARKRAAPKPKLKLKAAEVERQRQLKIGRFEKDSKPTLRDLVRAIEEARKWEPQAVVLYVQRQRCLGCGEEARNTVGLFVRAKHRISGAMKFAPANSEISIDLYPRELRECAFDVPACPICFRAQDLVDMVFAGIHTPPSGQLPLFNSLL